MIVMMLSNVLEKICILKIWLTNIEQVENLEDILKQENHLKEIQQNLVQF